MLETLIENRERRIRTGLAIIGAPIVIALTAYTVGGCDDPNKNQAQKPTPTHEEKHNIYTQQPTFSTFGNVESYYSQLSAQSGITAADIDGDGDQDIIVLNCGKIILYENTMPQKTAEKK